MPSIYKMSNAGGVKSLARYHDMLAGNAVYNPAIISDILVVAGGGGGGFDQGGGGGAGGLLYLTSQSLTYGTTHSLTIGGGGSAAPNANTSPGSKGANSVFGLLATAFGGGGGNSYAAVGSTTNNGSGGGANVTSGTGNPGTAGQGYRGGNLSGSADGGSGGGGAGATGQDKTVYTNPSAGGVGLAYTTIGAATSSGQNVSGVYYFAGGGGGSMRTNGYGRGAGGYGGGGTGGDLRNVAATNATANTGGGGGGSDLDYTGIGSGGSGIIVVKYPDTYPDLTTIAVGLTYTKYVTGGFKYYKFTSGTGTVTI